MQWGDVNHALEEALFWGYEASAYTPSANAR